ncbi:MAG: hypothetical protein NTV34_07820, partial [Proteobacteria bacterium]|nr:hypothetical protein [Pseudomonadota bacterium]
MTFIFNKSSVFKSSVFKSSVFQCLALAGITLGLSLVIYGCKMKSNAEVKGSTSTQQDNNENSEVVLAFSQPLHKDIAAFMDVIRGNNKSTIQLSVLRQIPKILEKDIKVSNVVTIQGLSPGPGIGSFVGVDFGGRIFILKKQIATAMRVSEKNQDLYESFDSIPTTFLAAKPVEDRIRSFLDQKYLEQDRNKRIITGLDSIEFLARMFPGVDGTDRAIRGTGSERLLGAVSAVADVATLGIGSKVKLVANGSKALVITGASVRLGAAAAKVSQGKADYATGIDAALAVTEVGLTAVTFVKIKLTSAGRGVVAGEGAELVSKQIGKTKAEVLEKGLGPEDLEKLGIPGASKAGARTAIEMAKSYDRDLRGMMLLRDHAKNVFENGTPAQIKEMISKIDLYGRTNLPVMNQDMRKEAFSDIISSLCKTAKNHQSLPPKTREQAVKAARAFLSEQTGAFDPKFKYVFTEQESLYKELKQLARYDLKKSYDV